MREPLPLPAFAGREESLHQETWAVRELQPFFLRLRASSESDSAHVEGLRDGLRVEELRAVREQLSNAEKRISEAAELAHGPPEPKPQKLAP